MIPGSALKGVLAHHVHAVYGGDGAAGDEQRKWRGPIWKDRQLAPDNGAGEKSGPTDWDDPNPVGFITVRPGIELLLVLSGPDEWTALAMDLLYEALKSRGAGGKTSAGYGRIA